MRIIQKFNWDLNDIKDDIIECKKQGFDTILVGPLQPHKNPDITLDELNGKGWWQAYQPLGFKIGNVLGSTRDLKRLAWEAHRHGMKILVDVVSNHVAGDERNKLDLHRNVDRRIADNQKYWIKRRKKINGNYVLQNNNWHDDSYRIENVNSWDNRDDVITGCIGMPSLRTDNYDVQNMIANFMNQLIDLGVDGFRIDAAKNIALPYEGCEYFTRIPALLKNTQLGERPYIFSEVLYHNRPDIVREYTKYADVFTDNYEVNQYDSRAIGCCESHDQYLQANEFGHSILHGNDFGHRYCDLVSKKEKTLFYVRHDDYKVFRKLQKLKNEVNKEINPIFRKELKDEKNEL